MISSKELGKLIDINPESIDHIDLVYLIQKLLERVEKLENPIPKIDPFWGRE